MPVRVPYRVGKNVPEESYTPDRLQTTVRALREVKDEGKIRAIGVASHELRFLAELMRKYDYFDSVMVPYNYHDQEAREVLFAMQGFGRGRRRHEAFLLALLRHLLRQLRS